MREKLTDGQSKFLSFLLRYYQDKGYPPTVKEIKEGLGIVSSMGVQRYFASLERKGYIKRTNKARAIEFCQPLKGSQPITLSPPLVEGKYTLSPLLKEGASVCPWHTGKRKTYSSREGEIVSPSVLYFTFLRC